MKNNKGHRQFLKGSLILVAVFAWAAIPFILNKVEANGDSIPISTITANLVSPTGSVNPHGDATYEVYESGQRELEVEVEDMNLANGTVLTAIVDNNSVGQFTVSLQRAKLKLRTQDGQTVPTINNGSTVQVVNGNALVVSGVFGGVGGTPTPSVSPTGSPNGTPSPTVSPTVSPTASPSPTGTPNAGDLFAGLTGGTVNGVLPGGFAQFELHSSRIELEVRVRQVNLTNGTTLGVMVNGNSVGQMILESGEGRLRLRSDRGENVPAVVVGSTITVQNSGTTILSGVFGGASPSPSPTPSGSPSPSPSPSPSMGRYFETHPTGAQVEPPVATNGNAEFKIFLNATETQATLTGEFHNLSSAQTGAKIVAEIGSNTVVHDFGAIGGINGNFQTVTINVTSVQVQQLRAGLCFVTVTSANNPNGELRGRLTQHSNRADFDGDGSNDLAVYRPNEGAWYAMNSQGFSAMSFGGVADVPVSADYDGDGKTDSALFRNVNGAGVWEIKRSSDGGVSSTQFGFATDTPVRGDFDGDGRNDVGVYRASSATWYVQKSDNTGFIIVQFGASEDIPLATDLDGDGKHDVAVFRPSTGVWYWIKSSNGSVGAVKFGQTGDKPIVGDFDGDGRDDITVYRPSNGVWYIWRSVDGSFDIRQFGIAEDVPVAGSYDGDNKTDIAVFRPSTGVWYIWRSSDGGYDARQFGLNGDVPTTGR